MNMETVNKFGVTVGSIVVDMTMVITMVWWGATQTERLEGVNKRVVFLENNGAVPMTNRMSVVETQLKANGARIISIEGKVDLLLIRQATNECSRRRDRAERDQ